MKFSWDEYKPLIGISPTTLTLPTSADLDQFETRLGFKLPGSYRDFALAFGLGCLTVNEADEGNAEYRIAIPGFHGEMPHCDPLGMTDYMHSAFGSGYSPDPVESARAARLILFCHYVDDQFFGWDPTEVTDPESNELSIYRISNHYYKNDGLVKVADSFDRLILQVLTTDRLNPNDPEAALNPAALIDDEEDDEEDDFEYDEDDGEVLEMPATTKVREVGDFWVWFAPAQYKSWNVRPH